MPSSTKQLNVALTPHLSKFVRSRVKSGRYADESEVVRDALRLLEQVDTEEGIVDPPGYEAEVRKGLEAIERGDYIEINGDEELHAFFEDIKARGMKRLAARRRQIAGRK